LNNVRVTGNRATLGGGGIFSAGSREDDAATLTLSATDIMNNTARTGGGLFNGEAAFAVFSNDSTVTGNRASASGGGIQNTGRIDLQDTVVSGNTPNNCVGVTGC
jgi:predicted outer membrane repeat protein